VTGVALIGTGGVARLHARAVHATPLLQLKGAWSRDAGNVRRFAAEVATHAYASLDDLLGDPAVEAVAVCTPAAQHVAMATRALDAGKHVIVEKPVAATVAEIDGLKAAAARASRVCMPCHNYIYAPDLRRAKRLADEGCLGRIGSFWLVYNLQHPADIGAPGLTMRGLMMHHAYATLFFLGRPVRVTAAAGNVHFDDPAAADQIMISCTLPDGSIGNLWGSFATDDRTSEPWTVVYKLLGTKGGFTSSWNALYLGEETLPGWSMAAYPESFEHVYDYFARACLGDGAPPLSTLDDARDALRLVEAAERALAAPAAVDYG